MPRHFRWVCCLTLAAAACAGEERAPAAARLPDPLNRLGPPPKLPGGLPAAIVVELPETPAPARTAPRKPLAMPSVAAPGYKLTLSGELTHDLTLTPERSPVLVRGALVVPAGKTLAIKEGVTVHFQPDPTAAQAERQNGQSDPARRGMLWVYGRLLAGGLSGHGVTFAAHTAASEPAADGAGLYFYGDGFSELRGVKLHGVDVTQASASGSGVVQWLGCEFTGARHYALPRGAAVFIHCTFRRCGGLFAAYPGGAWSLLAARCAFDSCAEGVVLGETPGQARLIVQDNNFKALRGPALRAAPASRAQEILIGENWYGAAEPEAVDARIVDVRSDAALRTRFNTRPPAGQPFAGAGVDATPDALARSFKEWDAVRQRLLTAHQRASVPMSRQP